jgi:TorA maturation chaperone TorD
MPACIACETDLSLLLARGVLYRFGALALLDPRLGGWEDLDDPWSRDLVSAAAGLVRDLPLARAADLGPGELPPEDLDPDLALARLPCSPAALNMAYERTFGLLVSSPYPPYETEYIDSKFAFQRSQTLADIAGFYRAFGYELSPEHRERPDHVSLELEFMSLLCSLEHRALTQSDGRGAGLAAVCREAQQKFLAEHLCCWLPAFATLLHRTAPEAFYSAVGSCLSALIAAERASFQIRPHRFTTPSAPERPEECEGCLLQPGAWLE